ncbi:MAG: DM13 domain-containing protein [Chitinophagaceae bacterium]
MTKTFLSTIIAMTFFMISCKKNTPENASEILPVGTVISMASFVSNAHTTSGSVKLVQESNNKKYLVFENFRTDNGPDLRVWLSPNNNGAPYHEIGVLKAVSGNFSYELNPMVNHATHNRVLIWCEDFAILFGHAVL